ncbi:hypothetical protein A2U01_0011390, partial [Trifolium medium]|nr:hypothetical protein [Trifolium medium]
MSGISSDCGTLDILHCGIIDLRIAWTLLLGYYTHDVLVKDAFLDDCGFLGASKVLENIVFLVKIMNAKVENGNVGHWDESANPFFIAKVFYLCMQRSSHCITGLVMSPMNCGEITNKSLSTKYGPSTCGYFVGLLTQWLDKIKWLNSLCGTVSEITNVGVASLVELHHGIYLDWKIISWSNIHNLEDKVDLEGV